MISWLNHVAIAVPDLKKASAQYAALGATVSEQQDLQEHGVAVVFVTFPNTKIELLHPLDENSPIAGFLEKNPRGGVHHLCFEVENLDAASRKVAEIGVRILGNGSPKIGAHGKPVVFLNPSDFQGTLLEFEQM
ncbi:methylmalonyl-CoA epimerase [Rhizobium leguminosarum]|uniref:methylmalonyl-CoA epimerase n=1 Tax=Rhizobium leguminosarum TaxID=384 RepID=UPI0024A9D240|nr:methylmalonyl-CoA epimerase [Rhizobium leguminosarum]MDI5929690.1 methylmalonyl-CoA epimerase [Rhizobium leguminosarum]